MPARDRGGHRRPLRALRELSAAPPPPSPVPRIALVTVASVVGTIVVPSIVISLYAAALPGADRVTAFALRVAEPIALATAVVVTASGARWVGRTSPRPRAAGFATGLVATLAGVASASWVGDVDGWTAAAVALQPLAGLLGGFRAVRDAGARGDRGARDRGDGSDRAVTGEARAPAARGTPPRVVSPAVAFEATLLPPSASRTGERAAAARPPEPAPASTPESPQH